MAPSVYESINRTQCIQTSVNYNFLLVYRNQPKLYRTHASHYRARYPRVSLIRNSLFARNVPFSQTRSHMINIMNKLTNGVRTVDRALLSHMLQLDFLGSHILYSISKAYPRPISAFFPMGRLFGTSRPNTLVCWHGYQSGSFLIWRHYRASK